MEQLEIIESFTEMVEALNVQSDQLFERIKRLEHSFGIRRRLPAEPQPVIEEAEEEEEQEKEEVEVLPQQRASYYRQEVVQPRQKRKYTRREGSKVGRPKKEKNLFEAISEDGHTQVTPANTTEVVRYFMEHNNVNVPELHEVVGGARSLVLHFIRILKKNGYIQLENGAYNVTDNGREAFEKWLSTYRPEPVRPWS